MNSNWLRGYGDPPPRTLIVVGIPRGIAGQIFESCEPAGRISNHYGIRNDETNDVFVCRRLRQSWPEFWKRFKYYG
jgi:hypothetical protein